MTIPDAYALVAGPCENHVRIDYPGTPDRFGLARWRIWMSAPDAQCFVG